MALGFQAGIQKNMLSQKDILVKLVGEKVVRGCSIMEEEKKVRIENYREELIKLFEGMEDSNLIEYFYIFCTGKAKWYLENNC